MLIAYSNKSKPNVESLRNDKLLITLLLIRNIWNKLNPYLESANPA
jgi:hypothetical protein